MNEVYEITSLGFVDFFTVAQPLSEKVTFCPL